MDDATALARNQRLSETRTHQVFARAAAVADHHHHAENPDKPLWLMVPGGAIALLALLGIIWTGYQFWVATPAIPADTAIPKLVVSLGIYFISLFGFSYGYELYDVPKALRLTAIIGLIGLAAVFILLALGALLKGSGSGSKSSKSSDTRSSGSGSGLGFGGSSSSSYTGSGGGLPISLNLGRPYGSSYARGYGPSLGSSMGNPAPPGCCSFCSRPLPPEGTLVAQSPVEGFCPKCGQPFEAAGDAVHKRGAGQA